MTTTWKKPGAHPAAAIALLTPFVTPSYVEAAESSGTGWFEALDHYCERVGPGFWAEPLNALTNAAFLIAAGVILDRQRRSAWTDRPLIALALLASTVGVGPFLFHTFANRWSLIADMLPIAIFIYAYFFFAVRWFLSLGTLTAGIATGALLLSSPILEALFRPLLGASASYAPGLIATFGVAAAVPILRRGSPPPLLVAAGLAFSVALAFRMLDASACSVLPSGTHFLWHTFNALAIGLSLLAPEKGRHEGKLVAQPFEIGDPVRL